MAPPPSRKTSEGFIPQEVESLGGLSRDTAQQFTARIQPILLNKCGNAHCHGVASDNGFKVSNFRTIGHSSRQTSEKNLADALQYIELDQVGKSRLLTALQGAHGGKGTIFVGQTGAEQAKTVRSWVRTVAQEKRNQAEELEQLQLARSAKKSKSKKSMAQDRVIQASAISEKPAEPARPRQLPEDDEAEPLEAQKELPPKKERRADPTDAKALATESEDAFDPEQFNQRNRRR